MGPNDAVDQWLCGTTVDIQQISKARRIKHVRSNRDILRESDSRYSQRPGIGKWGCVMISLRWPGRGVRIAA
jgi:hypothetical protein